VCKVTKVQVTGYYSLVKVNTKINVATLLRVSQNTAPR